MYSFMYIAKVFFWGGILTLTVYIKWHMMFGPKSKHIFYW